MFLNISSIDTSDRIREDYGSDSEWKEFKSSFPQFGQLQAIKVEPLAVEANGHSHRLVSGGRRITAVRQLHEEGISIPGVPKDMIEVTIGDAVPERVKMMREFAENMHRKDFTVQEKAKYISNFHKQMLEESDGKWTQEMTAWALRLSPTSISHYVRLEEAIKTNPTVAKAATMKSAVKRMKVHEELQNRHEAAMSSPDDSFKRASDILSLEDARSWILSIPDGSVDFINFDPPWGDDVSHKSAANHEEFDDSTEYSDSLMRDLFPHLFRVLKDNRFCVFWHRMWASERMAELALSFGFNLTHTRTPAIWYKPDKITDQNREPEKRMIEAYEPFYLLRKGDPIFHERFANNVFAFPRVPLGQLIHPTEKPPELCAAVLRLTTVPGETGIDPTAGSSAMLEELVKNNRKAKGCELSEHYHKKGIVRLADRLKTFATS